MSTTPSNEVAVREPSAIIAPASAASMARSFQAASDLDSWIGVVDNIAAFADQVCRTSFVPKAYRGDAAAVCAAILTGRELGLPPMTALRHIQVVEGSPGLSAEYKRARVLAAGHRLDITEHTTEACTVTGHRKGHEPVTVRFTIQDARRAGLVESKPGHGPRPYVTRPRRMLFARACTEVCDALFTDLTNGLPTAELMEDDAEAGEMSGYAEQAAPPERQRVTGEALRERAAARQAATATADVLASRDRVDAIWGHLTRLGHDEDKAWRLRVISSILSKEVTSSGDLTTADADRVIADLEKRAPEAMAPHGEPEPPAQEPRQLAYDGKDPRGDILVRLGQLGVTGATMEHVGAILGTPPPPSLEQVAWNDAVRLAQALARCEAPGDLEALERDGLPGGE